MGYGARALQALNAYYSGEYFNLDESSREEPSYPDASAINEVGRDVALVLTSLYDRPIGYHTAHRQTNRKSGH